MSWLAGHSPSLKTACSSKTMRPETDQEAAATAGSMALGAPSPVGYGGPSWWPASVLQELPRSVGLRTVLVVYLFVSLAAVGSGVLMVAWDWSGIPITVATVALEVTIYPPLVITFLLVVWLGPSWSVPVAYLTTLLLAVYSGMSVGMSALFALASPVEVLVFWGSMVIVGLSPSLHRRRDLLLLLFAALVATVASSVAVPLWNAEHGLDLLTGQRVWRGWVIGAVLQVVLIVAPAMRWGTAPVQRWLALQMPEPPRHSLSIRKSIVLVALVFVMLAILLSRGIVSLLEAFASGQLTVAEVSTSPPELVRGLLVLLGLGFTTMLLVLVVFTSALARTNERDRILALVDPLTETLNRRAFQFHFRQEVARTKRLGRGLSLLLFDIDHFKRINDEYGHQVGDEVLRALAFLVRGLIRPTDFLFRWGGEEFVVLLPHTDFDAALEVAQRLCVSVSSRRLIELGSGEGPEVTVSVGIASALTASDAESLVSRADAACYAAKRTGRNCVVADPRSADGTTAPEPS